jgi:hypothetical protein
MTLREVTRTVLGLVENVNCCSLVVNEDASLKTFAASRMGAGRTEFTRSPLTRIGYAVRCHAAVSVFRQRLKFSTYRIETLKTRTTKIILFSRLLVTIMAIQ